LASPPTCPSANAPELPAGFAVLIIAQFSALERLSVAQRSISQLFKTIAQTRPLSDPL
jgi:hypothetical protein